MEDKTINKGKITETNLVIEVTDPDNNGNNKLKRIKIFKLRVNLFLIHITNRITNIVYTELNCVAKSPLLKNERKGKVSSLYQPA